MPRNNTGTYALAANNPVITDTEITVTWANGTMEDLQIAMTDSLSRSGKGGMLVPFTVPNGSATLPSLSFVNDPASGLYKPSGSGDVRMSSGGTDRMRWRGAPNLPEVWDGAAWQVVATTDIIAAGFVNLTSAQTINGIKTFGSNPISTAAQSTAVNALTRKDYVLAQDAVVQATVTSNYANTVKTSGTQTVAGAKTFSSNPNSSAAQSSSATALTRRDYVLAQVATKAALAGSTANQFYVKDAGTATNRAMTRDDKATSTLGGTLKVRRSGTTLYITANGSNA